MRTTLLISLSICFGQVFAETLRVPQTYSSIQTAVNVSQLGDTILLDTGVYVEAVTLPPHGLTIGGPYLLTSDTAQIRSCTWRGFSNGDDTLRCLTADMEIGPQPSHRIIGIRFAASAAHSNEGGGAIRTSRQSMVIEHCIFDSCKAGYGGAIFARDSHIDISNSTFNFCGANRIAAVLRLVHSTARMDSCLIENSTAYHDSDEIPEQVAIQASNLSILNSEIRNCGHDFNPNGTYFVYTSKPPDTLVIVGSVLHDNHFNNLVEHSGDYLDFLRIDSNRFHQNLLTGALYAQSGPDCLTVLQAIGNVFETFEPVPQRGMHGVFALDDSRTHVTIMRNLVQHCVGGHTSFGTLFFENLEPRIVSHNYIVENSNRSVSWPPSGQILLYRNSNDDLLYNVFQENVGYAVFQGVSQGLTYARHNYWNHPTGPYDSVGNFGGQGDTVEWRIQYQPWELDTSFFSAAPEPREPVEIPKSFIGNAYPNPFNSIVTIEFVLLHDMEITLDIFDLTGRHVETVHKGRMNKGVHIRDWQPKSQASGIYFARLVGERNVTSNMKLLYLK